MCYRNVFSNVGTMTTIGVILMHEDGHANTLLKTLQDLYQRHLLTDVVLVMEGTEFSADIDRCPYVLFTLLQKHGGHDNTHRTEAIMLEKLVQEHILLFFDLVTFLGYCRPIYIPLCVVNQC